MAKGIHAMVWKWYKTTRYLHHFGCSIQFKNCLIAGSSIFVHSLVGVCNNVQNRIFASNETVKNGFISFGHNTSKSNPNLCVDVSCFLSISLSYSHSFPPSVSVLVFFCQFSLFKFIVCASSGHFHSLQIWRDFRYACSFGFRSLLCFFMACPFHDVVIVA